MLKLVTTFLTNKARNSRDKVVVKKSRVSLIKRALLLMTIGLIYTPIWEADILHFYGFYFLIGATVFMVSNRSLLLVSVVITLTFPTLMLFFDYDQNWHWPTLTYMNLWSFDGMVRHVFFNGFHPVFPWATLLTWSVITLITTETLFYLVRHYLADGLSFGISPKDAALLFSITIIPPLPQYIISAGSSACIVLVGCLYFSDKFKDSNINRWLCQTGQLSLTLYVAHVILGMSVLDNINRLSNQPIGFSLFSSLIFCICGVAFSVFWFKNFKVGPLESIFRKVAS
jgi:uncharacterized protein